jgi:DNA polymerase-1
VRAFDLPCLEQAGFEADDLIATYVRQACERGASATIVSSDKDLMQLVTDCVHMYDTMKDRRIGIPEVIEKFGVPPEKVVEVQALAGDSVDNVPGVPGIGVKTAAQLIGEYGDLETLLARAGEIKQQKRRETLIGNAEQARLSKRLVTLDSQVALEVAVDELAVHDPDYKTLIAFLKAMEFSTLTRRVAEKGDIDASAVAADPRLISHEIAITSPPPTPLADDGDEAAGGASAKDLSNGEPANNRLAEDTLFTPVSLAAKRAEALRSQTIDHTKYETVSTLEQLQRWMARAYETGIVAIDTETTSLDPMQAHLCGFSLAVAPGEACYVPTGHRDAGEGGDGSLFAGKSCEGQIPEAEALAAVKPMLEDQAVLKIGQNIKYDWLIFARRGIDINTYDDTMLMSYVLDAGRSGHGMDDMALRHLGHATVKYNDVAGKGKAKITFDCVSIEKATHYAAEDADVTLRLWQALKPRLAAEQVVTVYQTLERAMPRVLARMEERGIAIDKPLLAKLSNDFGKTQMALEQEINALAGTPLNPGSPKQLGEVLFGQMKLPGGTKTKTGQWATGAKALEDLAEQGHKLPQTILDWRQVAKLRSTYTDALPAYVNPQTQRVHTSYALAATSTGRLSSSEPNLQNIPIRTEEGRKIRRAFVATPGNKLVSADYSQIELRLLAEVAEVPTLRAAFRDGIDIHAMTASEIFGVPVKNMPPEVRRRAKAINFGIIYGISAFGLASQLGIQRDEAGAYIKKYFERFPGIRDYMETTKAFCREHGYVLTLFGRTCHYPDIKNSNASIRAFNERAAINARLQGSAADIIRRAMIRMEGELTQAKLDAQMLLQVHDELIFEVPERQVEKTMPVIIKVMETAPLPAVALSVPLQVEARAAGNWDEAH